MSVLILVEHDQGSAAPGAAEALTAGRTLALNLDLEPVAIVPGSDDPAITGVAAEYGVAHTITAALSGVDDYAPAAWAAALHAAIESTGASVVMTAGTDRGNEVLAHLGARMALPFIANCTEVEPGERWMVTRVRWGGSLLEQASLDAPVKILSTAPHSVEPEVRPVDATIESLVIALDEADTVVMVRDRIGASEGVTLATAPVVVSGGRGVGSPEGFGPLDELAALLGGVVGCSRVVTNNGWRPHSDQVGQTGTVVAPEVYIACGISGAIQHWVGMMNAKTIVAINTDTQAPMVTKSDYAIVGDLHEIVPAIVAAVEKRKAASAV